MYKTVGSFKWRLKIGKKDVTDRLLSMRVIQRMPQDLLFTVSMPIYQLHIELIDTRLGDISKGFKVSIVEDTNASGNRLLLPLFYIESISFSHGKLNILCLPHYLLRSIYSSIDSKKDFYTTFDIVPSILGAPIGRQPCLPNLDGYFSAISSPDFGSDLLPAVSLHTSFYAVPGRDTTGSRHVFVLSSFESPVCSFDDRSVLSIDSVESLPPVATIFKPNISYSDKPLPVFSFTGLKGPLGHLWYFWVLGNSFLFLSRHSLSVVKVLFSGSRKVCVFSVPKESEFVGYVGNSYVLFSMPDRAMVIDCFSGEVVFENKGSVLLSYAPSEVYFSNWLDTGKTIVYSLLSLSLSTHIQALYALHGSKGSKFYTASLFPIKPSLAVSFNKGVVYCKSSSILPYMCVEAYFVESEGRYYVLCCNFSKNHYACVPLDFTSKPLKVSLGVKGVFCLKGRTLGLVIHADGCRYEVRDIVRFSSDFTSMYEGQPKVTFEGGSAYYQPIFSPKTLPGVHTYELEEGYDTLSNSFSVNTFESLKKSFVKDKRYYVSSSSNSHLYISSRVKYREGYILLFSSDSSLLQVFRTSTSMTDALLYDYVSTVSLFDNGLNVSVPNMLPLPASVLQVFSSWRIKDIVAGQFLHKKEGSLDWDIYKISPNRLLPLGAPVKFIDTDGIENEGKIVSSEYIFDGTEKIKLRVLY